MFGIKLHISASDDFESPMNEQRRRDQHTSQPPNGTDHGPARVLVEVAKRLTDITDAQPAKSIKGDARDKRGNRPYEKDKRERKKDASSLYNTSHGREHDRVRGEI